MRPGISVAFEPGFLIGRQLLGREAYVLGKPYTSGTPVTVTEEVTSPTTFGGSQDVMIAVTWTSQVSRLLARLAMTGGSFLERRNLCLWPGHLDIAPITERHETTTFS